MGNQVKPVRCLWAGVGHGWLHCIGHALSSMLLVGLWEMPGYGILNYIKGCTWVREFGYMVPNIILNLVFVRDTTLAPPHQVWYPKHHRLHLYISSYCYDGSQRPRSHRHPGWGRWRQWWLAGHGPHQHERSCSLQRKCWWNIWDHVLDAYRWLKRCHPCEHHCI